MPRSVLMSLSTQVVARHLVRQLTSTIWLPTGLRSVVHPPQLVPTGRCSCPGRQRVKPQASFVTRHPFTMPVISSAQSARPSVTALITPFFIPSEIRALSATDLMATGTTVR